MARGPDVDDPLAALRALLRDLRASGRLATNPIAGKLCPGVPDAQRRSIILNAVRVALYRLPVRQREVLRRYDIAGEPAATVALALGLSSRQFFRDRRAALARLNKYLLGPEPERRESRRAPIAQAPAPWPGAASLAVTPDDADIAPRTMARNLAQSGSSECLRVLWELARDIQEPVRRAALLLDLADAALDFDELRVVQQAERAASTVIVDDGAVRSADDGYLVGRLERVRAHLAPSRSDTEQRFASAIALLRCSITGNAKHVGARWALAETLGDLALHFFAHGAFAQARVASTEAAQLIETFALWSQPRALEVLAMDATLGACLSGKSGAAIRTTTSLLTRALDSGWCSTAWRLGADIIGLNGIRGDYEEAIRWYRRMAATPAGGARPGDRTTMAMEAAHAYTMLRRPLEALRMLNDVRPGNGCPGGEAPVWHAFASAALERAGQDGKALAHARLALTGFSEQQAVRGVGDAHRLIAIAAWKLRDMRTAGEHILEAQRLVESAGTPYAVLRTLVAKASITGSAALKQEAIELARLLLDLGRDPAT